MSLTGLLLMCLILLSATAGRAATVLTFEGIPDRTAIGDFYNGGLGGNLGISFSSLLEAVIASDAGGTGAFSGEPSPHTVARIRPSSIGIGVILVPGGFDTAFSLYYSGPEIPVLLFEQQSGGGPSGPVIGNFLLRGTSSSDEFLPNTFLFSGTARTVLFGFVEFGDQPSYIDNVQLGEEQVPEASTTTLLATGIVALYGIRRCRQRSRRIVLER